MPTLPDGSACPVCHAELRPDAAGWRCSACATQYGTLDDVPVLVADADHAEIDLRATGGALPTYDASTMGIGPLDEALARGDRILELGAGLEVTDAPGLVTSDAFVYGTRGLDVVADAHRLPFADASFDFVFSLAVFEHLHSPWVAAQEIARVLRPGGGVYTLCAFMQPLHGYPSHYFNTTESGLAQLFQGDFDVRWAGPSAHCPPRESLTQLHRMREMADALQTTSDAPVASRARARLLKAVLGRSIREYARLADQMIATPRGRAAWRQFAPAVDAYAVRTAS